jgi:hypothetical protein
VSVRPVVKRIYFFRSGTTCALLAALALAPAEAQHPSKSTVHSRIKSRIAQAKRARLAELRLADGIRSRQGHRDGASARLSSGVTPRV